MGRKLSQINNLLPSFIDIIIVYNIYLVWKSEKDLGALPIFCNHLLFCNHLQAGDVSISLASSKSWISPLKAFVKFKNLIIFHHQAFIICKLFFICYIYFYLLYFLFTDQIRSTCFSAVGKRTCHFNT